MVAIVTGFGDFVVRAKSVKVHMESYDHIIVGTGQATGTLLGKLIPTGDTIAVIEAAEVGGSCVNYGCTPTKTLVASAKALHKAGRGDTYGFHTNNLAVDFPRVMERMNEVRHASRDGLTGWMEDTDNVSLIRGWARFIDDKTLKVGSFTLRGNKVYINVGTRPAAPPIDGIGDVPWVDSAGLLETDRLPAHLLILGGGYIGMEFAQIFRRFGSKVTVVQRAASVMPREDEDVSESIQGILESEGVEIMCNTTATAVTCKNGHIELCAERKGEALVLEGTDFLVAAGRRPNSDTLDLKNTGIQVDEHGYIQVDDHCQTHVEGVFAVGDVNGHGAFTHTSVNDAEIVLDYLNGGQRRISQRIPIYALFTDPPLGRVGMTEREALHKGHRILRATRPMSKISRAKEMGETDGFAKLIVDADTDMILGSAILGPGGDEVINMFAAIMHSGISCRKYREVVLVHPTISELMPFVLDALEEVSSPR